VERAAWYRLSHWADDDDVRAKDPRYLDMQQRQICEVLGDLEGLDAGYLPSEIGRGEHQAWHMPPLGCALFVIAGSTGLYFLLAFLV
jgi:hypothetical protein